jgi:DNA-directed RNA polymerase subunit F
MIGKESSDSKPVSIAKVLEVLEHRKKGGELGYEQQLVYDYAKKFSKLSEAESKKMYKELEELGLRDKTAYKIIEILPVDIAQLKLILVMERRALEEQEIANIMKVVDSYRK